MRRFDTCITILLVATLAESLPAQTYKVIHNFTGTSQDGGILYAGVTMDAQGNLYGTTLYDKRHGLQAEQKEWQVGFLPSLQVQWGRRWLRPIC